MLGAGSDDVITIMKYLDESKFEELHLSMGDFKLILKRSKGQTPKRQSETLTSLSTTIGENTSIPGASSSEPSLRISSSKEFGASVQERIERPGTSQIKAPIMGTFYRAPKPGAKPFVEVGDEIKEDDTVCIIEVMKLYRLP